MGILYCWHWHLYWTNLWSKEYYLKPLWKHISKKQITLIVGARQTGKTTLMQQIYTRLKREKKQTFFISMEDPNILETLDQHPDNLFKILPPLSNNGKIILFLMKFKNVQTL